MKDADIQKDLDNTTRKSWRRKAIRIIKPTNLTSSELQIPLEVQENFRSLFGNKSSASRKETSNCHDRPEMCSTLAGTVNFVEEQYEALPKSKESFSLIGLDLKTEFSPLKSTSEYALTNFEDIVIRGNFLQNKKVTTKMRDLLISWMRDICSQIETSRETFHLAVLILDRFISCTDYSNKNNFQLVGTVCMQIANKLQGRIYVPSSSLLQASENIFTLSQLIEMERLITVSLEFRLLTNTLVDSVVLLMTRWDEFVDVDQKASGKFWVPNISNFAKLTKVFFMCDMVLFNWKYINLERRRIALAIIYLIVRKGLIDERTRNIELTEKEKEKADEIFNRFISFCESKETVESLKKELNVVEPIFEKKFKLKEIGSMSNLINKNVVY